MYVLIPRGEHGLDLAPIAFIFTVLASLNVAMETALQHMSHSKAEELAAAYPADVRPMGGSWYEITFQGAFTYGN